MLKPVTHSICGSIDREIGDISSFALAIYQAADAFCWRMLEFRREQRIRQILIADWTQEAVNGRGAYRGGSAIGG